MESYLGRLIAIVDAIAEAPGALTQARLADDLGLPRPSVHRLMKQLGIAGLVSVGHDGKVRLGPTALRWGAAASDGIDVGHTAQAYLEAAVSQVGESCQVGVNDGAAVIYVRRVSSPQPIRLGTRLGSRMPMHSTSLGKAILAFLPKAELDAILKRGLPARTLRTITDEDALRLQLQQIAERGWSTEEGENEEGVTCYAAPIFDSQGAACAAFSVAVPDFRSRESAEYSRVVADAARGISFELGAPASRIALLTSALGDVVG